MIRKFIFFEGIIKDTFVFETNHIQRRGNNIEEELTRLMSEEIARGVDEDIIRRLTFRVNGDSNNLDYLNRWINMGGQRA